MLEIRYAYAEKDTYFVIRDVSLLVTVKRISMKMTVLTH